MHESAIESASWKRIPNLIIPYVFIVGLFQIAGFSVLGLEIVDRAKEFTTYQTFIIGLFNLAGTFLVVWFFRRYVDKHGFASLGFQYFKTSDIFYGVVLGFTIMLVGFSCLLLTGQIQFLLFQYETSELLFSAGLFASVAFAEELLIRGYVLNNLMASMNRYAALFLSSIIFSLMHAANPNASWFALFDLFLAGILLGISYVHTKNLWFPIALHFSWNFFQGPVFGFNVSGREFYSIIRQSNNFENIWNGGNFGFEGSVLSAGFQIVAIGITLMMFRKQQLPQIRNLNEPVVQKKS